MTRLAGLGPLLLLLFALLRSRRSTRAGARKTSPGSGGAVIVGASPATASASDW